MGKKNRVPETPVEEIDILLKKRDKHTRRVAKADARRKKDVDRAQKRWAKQVKKSPQKIARLDEKLAAYAFENRSWLILQFSKTIRRFWGVLTFVQRPPKFVMPKGESEIISYLERRRGGKVYLDYTPKLNRTRLASAPKGLKQELRKRFGVDYGPHLTVLVKSPIEAHAKTIGEQRNNVWPRKQK